MKRAWQGMHGQLERQQALNARLWTENRLDKVRHGMRPLFWGQVVQIAFGVVLAWMAAAFWVPRMAVTH
jgi:serine/threonine-protein kinase